MEPGASPPTDDDASERAALGYLIWPLAALDVLRESPNATIWSRLHARQALVFGILALGAYVIVLALPLVLTALIPAVSTGATIVIYAIGMVADVIALVALFVLAFRAYARAKRGQLFGIPVVTTIVDRYFPVRGIR